MATATLEEPRAVSSYLMPVVHIGDVVLWHDGGHRNEQPCPAIVTRANRNSVCLSILSQENQNLIIREHVRHISDPGVKDAERAEFGCWEHTEQTKRLASLERSVKDCLQGKKG